MTVTYRNMRSAAALSLDVETLLDHAAALGAVAEVAFESQWGSSQRWYPFVASLLELSVSLDKLCTSGKLIMESKEDAAEAPASVPQDTAMAATETTPKRRRPGSPVDRTCGSTRAAKGKRRHV